MKGPVVAVDVSKGMSHYQGFKGPNEKYKNVRKISHDKKGFDELISFIREMELSLGTEVCAVYEATGVYHRVLKKVLEDNGITQYILNPLLSAKTRKNDSLRGPKTDRLDPKSIATAYYSHDLNSTGRIGCELHELRELNRYYEDRLVHIRKDKVAFRAQLDIVFPGYDRLFSDLYGQTSMAVIEKYPHPELLQKKNVRTVAKVLEKKTCHIQSRCEEDAKKAIEYSRTVYSGCGKNDIEVTILRRLISQLKADIEEAERIIREMVRVARDLPNFTIIRSIPGIGDNLAARILAEIGDIGKFKSRNQLTAYAGIDPAVYESGQRDGQHLHITKKGNKRLRCLLYMAVTCSISLKSDNNKIKDFYIKKKQQSNPMSSKAAKIACANKLLRIIYYMCKNGTMYQ